MERKIPRFSYIYTSPLPISLFGSFWTLDYKLPSHKKNPKNPTGVEEKKNTTPILGHNAELDFYKDRQVAVSSGVTPAGCRHFWCSAGRSKISQRRKGDEVRKISLKGSEDGHKVTR